MSAPFILSIIGKSDSGKTTLILKLLPELRKRRYRVAVAKHCPHGFDLDIEGKDSWKFAQAGGEGIFLSSPRDIAVLRPRGDSLDIKGQLQNYFSDFDIVLMEGYNSKSGIKKIEIIRKGIGRIPLPLLVKGVGGGLEKKKGGIKGRVRGIANGGTNVQDVQRDGVIAYVSDMHLDTEKKVFSPDDISAIADFIETFMQNSPTTFSKEET